MDKTASGLDQNIAGALTYALGWITGAIFLLTEPTNKFVRFHALQSLIVFGGLSLVWFIAASSIPIIGLVIALVILPPLSVFLWLLLMFKAYQGDRFKLPFAGEIADQRER
jgi:uncharacterized membrane protein